MDVAPLDLARSAGAARARRAAPAAERRRPHFPFPAIVGQDEIKLALLACCVDPGIGGVLALGDRGTGKSTIIRALAGLLPPMRVTEGCRFGCDPALRGRGCTADCPWHLPGRAPGRVASRRVPVPVVDLPLGATEDRVTGALDLERALAGGVRAFEPGLLARAHRGFLYIDEVNLLEDHLVDLLLDVSASGENVVERDGLSVRHPARFVLIGSGNPEEGDLRPQLLDRFGLAVEVRTPASLAERVAIVRRREAFERDPPGFAAEWRGEERRLREAILSARRRLAAVEVSEAIVARAAGLCIALGADGLRGELTLIRAARAVAALEGETRVAPALIDRLAVCALRHRLRRNPLDETGSASRIERAVAALGDGGA